MPFDDVWNHTGSFKDRAAENKEILMYSKNSLETESFCFASKTFLSDFEKTSRIV